MIKIAKKVLTKNNNALTLSLAENSLTSGKTALIIGVFHGDEPEGEMLIRQFMGEISTNPEILKNNRILFIPCLNPDGKLANTRKNANGVDLNRNFPTQNWELGDKKDDYFGGKLPASEIETKFLIEIIDKYEPDRILSLHTPYRVVNFDGNAKELAKNISKINGYTVEENIGYPTPGSFGTYAGIEREIPTITLELPDNESPEKLWKSNKKVFEYFVDL